MVQVDFDLTPPRTAMFGEPSDKPAIILFGRIKISVDERPTVVVAPFLHYVRILITPTLQPLFLLVVSRARMPVLRNNSRFKMIGKRENEMNFTSWQPAGKPLPPARRDYP
jgi:hypothetical protein